MDYVCGHRQQPSDRIYSQLLTGKFWVFGAHSSSHDVRDKICNLAGTVTSSNFHNLRQDYYDYIKLSSSLDW
jgi:hypothetical protein